MEGEECRVKNAEWVRHLCLSPRAADPSQGRQCLASLPHSTCSARTTLSSCLALSDCISLRTSRHGGQGRQPVQSQRAPKHRHSTARDGCPPCASIQLPIWPHTIPAASCRLDVFPTLARMTAGAGAKAWLSSRRQMLGNIRPPGSRPSCQDGADCAQAAPWRLSGPHLL